MRAAVLEEFGKPLVVQDVDLGDPRPGEVLVRLKACGVCHTDLYTASGADPSGYVPTVLGHEGAGVVEAIGDNVTLVQPGDHVITLFSPECGSCVHCSSGKTNICLRIREEQGKGNLPDGTTRLSRGGEPMRHFMGTSTFAEYTVMPEVALAQGRPARASMDVRSASLACGAIDRDRVRLCGRPRCKPGDTVRRLRRRAWSASVQSAGAQTRRVRRASSSSITSDGAPRGRASATARPTCCSPATRIRCSRSSMRPDGFGVRPHLRGDRPRLGDGSGGRGGADGLGDVYDPRRRRQGGDARGDPSSPDHRSQASKVVASVAPTR